MAKRYSWTFEYIQAMPFLDFVEVIEMINEGIREDFRDQMTLHAFGSWQIIESLKAMLGGNAKNTLSFEKYAKSLGLLEKENDLKNDNTKKEEALKTASEIVTLYKKGAKQKQ